MRSKNIKLYNNGSLLFELLIVISLLAVVLSVGSNAVFLSMRSSKISAERDVASNLASESLESVRSISEEDWQNIYSLTKGTGHYYPTSSSSRWILSSGDENITLNNIVYTRYITIDNVSRDTTTRNIEGTYISADDDPSTQKITVNVSWTGGSPITISEYFFRWRNKKCAQTTWTTADPGSTVHNCTDASYDSKDTAIDITGGTLKLQ